MTAVHHAAIIEWPSDAAEAPTLLLAPSLELLVSKVVAALADLADDAYADDRTFIDTHPRPDPEAPPADIARWLLAMREATTAPWVEVYAVDDDEAATASLLDAMKSLITGGTP